MARNETRHFKSQPFDRAHWHADAHSWRALANVTVASTLVVAVFVTAFALVEALFSNPASQWARQSPAPSDLHSLHATAQ